MMGIIMTSSFGSQAVPAVNSGDYISLHGKVIPGTLFGLAKALKVVCYSPLFYVGNLSSCSQKYCIPYRLR